MEGSTHPYNHAEVAHIELLCLEYFLYHLIPVCLALSELSQRLHTLSFPKNALEKKGSGLPRFFRHIRHSRRQPLFSNAEHLHFPWLPPFGAVLSASWLQFK